MLSFDINNKLEKKYSWMFLIDTNDKLEKNIFRVILSSNHISNIYIKDNRIVFIWYEWWILKISFRLFDIEYDDIFLFFNRYNEDIECFDINGKLEKNILWIIRRIFNMRYTCIIARIITFMWYE